MVQKVKNKEPLYGESSLSPYMQGVAARNSRYSQIFFHALPMFNLVNHNQVCLSLPNPHDEAPFQSIGRVHRMNPNPPLSLLRSPPLHTRKTRSSSSSPSRLSCESPATLYVQKLTDLARSRHPQVLPPRRGGARGRGSCQERIVKAFISNTILLFVVPVNKIEHLKFGFFVLTYEMTSRLGLLS